jgi:two-component system sensor histidine kinase SenX3
MLGAFTVWFMIRRAAAEPVDDLAEPKIEMPAGVREVLAVLGSPAVVIGPHDEVLESNTQARNIGIARGNRIAISELGDIVRTVRRERAARSVDLTLKRGGGTGATVHLSVRVAQLDDQLIVVLAEDRTSAIRVEETRRDFVANVSHELKTPIGAVALLAEALEGAADDPDAVHRFSARLTIESQRLGDLVQQIIDLSRLQADDPLVRAESVDVDDVLTKAVDRCRVDAEQRGVQLTVAGQRDCRLLGSERQLVTAVGNLVENAIIYSDPGARVAVAAHRVLRGEDEIVEITVSDTGIGIAPADLDRIFERFYRVDYARSRANGGTGLGLAIVKHIVAAHGGQVSVWSQPGQGSTFTIGIPAPAAPDQNVEDRTAATPQNQRRRTAAESVSSRTTENQEIVR